MKTGIEINYCLEANIIKENLKMYDSRNVDITKESKFSLLNLLGMVHGKTLPPKIFIYDIHNNYFMVEAYPLSFCYVFWSGLLEIENNSDYRAIVANLDGWGGLEFHKEEKVIYKNIYYDNVLVIECRNCTYYYDYYKFKKTFQQFCLKVWTDLPFFYNALTENESYKELGFFFKD